MAETVSVRIEKPELQEIENLSLLEGISRSDVLRRVLDSGLQELRTAHAVEQYRLRKVTAWKAARLAKLPLSNFMELLAAKGVDFHYGLRELKEDLGD
ncbi:UPF0175 family protein [Candidatus Woesearchaeota archaeon]|nr:UPF0175 family protein [Candidatus Woesearchaeota archaeon]